MPKNKVLVIGSGTRVQTSILPALRQLPDFEIAGVFSKSIKNFSNSGFFIQTINDLDSVDLSSIQLIIIAITTEAVPKILRQLVKKEIGHIVLMLDTPVLSPRGLGAAQLFKRFKKVLVSEDSIVLPNILAAKKIIESGKIGRLKKITFDRSVYKYHGLASLKMLVGKNIISNIRYKNLGDNQSQKLIFARGARILINEPRDYGAGKILIEGDRGVIADYDHHGENIYRIENQQDINKLKISGLKILIPAALEESSPFHYSPWDAIYDSFSIKIAERLGIFLDISFDPRISIFKFSIWFLSFTMNFFGL